MNGIQDIPNMALLGHPDMSLAHTHLPLPHLLSPILHVPNRELLVVPETYPGCYTFKPFFGQDISSAWNSNTWSPTHLCPNLAKSH